MVLFGFFALVLVSVYWVNRAVILFDQLIADGHSAGIFLEFSLLSLPKVIGLVLPMAAFAAAVYVTNRLSTESELTVMQATGFSPWRMARPVAVFGLIVAAMMAMLTHVLIPASVTQLKQREAEISGSVSARLLREGTFLHPTPGVTFYIGDITAEGELRDVYLSDRRQPARPVAYTARNAFLLRGDEGTTLVMVDGLAQSLDRPGQQLSTTTFADFAYDVSALVETRGPSRPRLDQMSTAALLGDPAAAAALTGDSLARVLEEAHMRFQDPLLAMVAALIGFSTLIAGGFSRMGLGRRIVLAIFLLVAVKLVESAVADPLRGRAALWPLVYVPTLAGLGMTWVLLWQAARPRRHATRPGTTAERPA
ncbi:MAG: LPS export ABC transporter permease LptF [Paracoccaceae bacterium]